VYGCCLLRLFDFLLSPNGKIQYGANNIGKQYHQYPYQFIAPGKVASQNIDQGNQWKQRKKEGTKQHNTQFGCSNKSGYYHCCKLLGCW
jgi:hypothetical protein